MFILFNFGWIIFWGIAYILLVRRGFLDKTFGFPFIAICVDSAWVFVFTFHYFQSPFMILFIILDVIFLYQLIKFRTSDFPKLSRGQYYGALILGLLTSYALIRGFTVEFADFHGVYSSFMNTLIASILFVVLILRRDNLQGQSIYIAIAKMLGTLSAVIAYNFFTMPANHRIVIFHHVFSIPKIFEPATPVPSYIGSTLLIVLGIAIFVYDVIYIGLVYKKSRELGLNPWRRW